MKTAFIYFIMLGLILTSSARTHTVKSGDTLWSISQKYHTNVDSLKKLNGLNSNLILVGQELKTSSAKTTESLKKKVSPYINPVTNFKVPEKLNSAQIKELLTPKTNHGFSWDGVLTWVSTFLTPPRRTEIKPSYSKPIQKALPRPVNVLPVKPPYNERVVEYERKPAYNRSDLALQVQLDRAGYSPGVIDGKGGHFTRLAQNLCPSSTLNPALSPTKSVSYDPSWQRFVNPNLPLTSSGHPNFTALSTGRTPMLYASISEMIAERFHCKVELLKQLNPSVSFNHLRSGQSLIVPNVETFQVEHYYSAETHAGLWTGELGKGDPAHHIMIDRSNKVLTLWQGRRIIRSFPVTLNTQRTPVSKRQVTLIAPGPHYKRKKTGLTLHAGPNSPVGIVWCAIGGSYGVHGTNNPDDIGRNSSSGCIRLANWDIVRLARLIRVNTPVEIIENAQYIKAHSPSITN